MQPGSINKKGFFSHQYIKGKKAKEPSSYACASKINGVSVLLDPKGGMSSARKGDLPVYMGLHFANEWLAEDWPDLHQERGVLSARSKPVTLHGPNIIMNSRFWVYAKSDIRMGDELFLVYGRDGNGEDLPPGFSPRF